MTRSRQSFRFLTAIGLAVICSALTALPVLAGIEGNALTIVATNAEGDYATLAIEVPSGPPPWVWSSNEIMEMRSDITGDLIATLNPGNRETSVEYIDDPIINIAFAASAGNSTTQIVINSGLLSFPAMPAEARASAGFSLTDADGDGATLTGIGDPNGAQGAYLAQYNGDAATLSGTTFAEVIQSINAGSFATQTASADVPPVGFLPIGVPVSDMSVLISFDLNANDIASGTSTYVIQQPPTSVETASWGGIKGLYR